MKKIGIIIPAGGAGTRMGGGTPKQFLSLGHDGERTRREPVLAHVIRAFRSVAPEADIVVALPADRIDEWARLCIEHEVPPHRICEGGDTRFMSVKNAISELEPECEYIAVHDAARPLVSTELILRTLETARRHGTAIPAVGLVDSVRRVRETASDLGQPAEHSLESSSYPEDRTMLRAVQTPQVFRADILRTGYERAAGDDWTDDATVVESVGYNVMLCDGERRNIKITGPYDLTIAEALIGQ